MDIALIALAATATVIAFALRAVVACRSDLSRDGAEPVVGVQRHGRTYLISRRHLDALDRLDHDHVDLGGWRAMTLAVLTTVLLLGALVRLA